MVQSTVNPSRATRTKPNDVSASHFVHLRLDLNLRASDCKDEIRRDVLETRMNSLSRAIGRITHALSIARSRTLREVRFTPLLFFNICDIMSVFKRLGEMTSFRPEPWIPLSVNRNPR